MLLSVNRCYRPWSTIGAFVCAPLFLIRAGKQHTHPLTKPNVERVHRNDDYNGRLSCFLLLLPVALAALSVFMMVSVLSVGCATTTVVPSVVVKDAIR